MADWLKEIRTLYEDWRNADTTAQLHADPEDYDPEGLDEAATEAHRLWNETANAFMMNGDRLLESIPDMSAKDADILASEIFGLIGDYWSDHQFLELMTTKHPQLGMSMGAALVSGRADQVLTVLHRLDSGAYI